LLTPAEQRLFRRLAVFAGGCTAEVAAAVCNASDDLDLLAALDSLVGKNLVQQEEQPGGEARFVMLETIREFALEQLAESGEGPRYDATTRHTSWRWLRRLEQSWWARHGTAGDWPPSRTTSGPRSTGWCGTARCFQLDDG
jgi:predicted ATPase